MYAVYVIGSYYIRVYVGGNMHIRAVEKEVDRYAEWLDSSVSIQDWGLVAWLCEGCKYYGNCPVKPGQPCKGVVK